KGALHRQEDGDADLPLVHAPPRRLQDRDGQGLDREAPRAHHREGGDAHGAAQPPRPAADDQTEDLRRAVAPAPGAAARRTQARLRRPPTVADAKTKKTFYLGTGRRKTAVARVRMAEGTGQVVINAKPVEVYFTEEKDRNAVYGPLSMTEMRNRVDVNVSVKGGGYSG